MATMIEQGVNGGVPNSLFNKIIAVNSECGKKTVNSIKLHLGNNLFGKKGNV
jgi:hypothetical protein